MSADPQGGRVLLVDDDETFRRVLAGELSHRGYEVATAATGEEALRQLEVDAPEVMLLDMRMPDLDGLGVLSRLRELDVPTGVVVLTGHGTIDTAIRAIRAGAFDYLEKPCPLENVELAIAKVQEHLRLVARQSVLQDGFAPPDVRRRFVGCSDSFTRLCATVERIARADSTTLICGETGVGKEMVAMLLHAQGPRHDAPFVVVDCAALDDDLLRSELFGHEKGAFTSAARLKHGLFEVANGGTLFLDEVGDTTPEIQAKLLRVLETGSFRRLGGTREITVDVRVISATNRDLQTAITRGRFREDLFFRLTPFTIEVPPLRERRADIPLLVEYYTKRLNRRFSLSCRFSPDAVEALTRRRWPGNVRELIHVLEQTLVLTDEEEIQADDLPTAPRDPEGDAERDARPPRLLPLAEVQKRHILAVVEQVGGNRAEAARILEVSERNLYRLLDKYGWTKGGSTADPDRITGS